MPPGNYSVKFSAAGFKTAEVPSVTVNVTETPVLNRSLEVGAQSEKITVESTQETIQTQNATNGGVVGSQEVTASAARFAQLHANHQPVPGCGHQRYHGFRGRKRHQDVAANGARQNQNNYSMDGSSIVNYVSGTAGQTGSYPGIAIPNPDSIQEFKVQTSQYDASSGRNPGANVTSLLEADKTNFTARVGIQPQQLLQRQRFLLQEK